MHHSKIANISSMFIYPC